jgi:DNA (cytosine-5)-methyltransferase 1
MMAANRRPPRPATPSRLEDAIARAAAPPTVGSLFSGVGGFDLGFDPRRDSTSAGSARSMPRCPRRAQAQAVPGETDMIYHRRPHHRPLHAVEPVDLHHRRLPLPGFVRRRAAGRARMGSAADSSTTSARIIRASYVQPFRSVIENVPGLLSSDGGRDMALVLAHAWQTLGARGHRVGRAGRAMVRSTAAAASRLHCLRILQEQRASARYSLSPRACRGILRRAEKQREDVAPVLSARASYDRGDGAEPLTFTFQRTDAYAEGDAGSTLAARESRGPQDLIASPLVDAGKRQWSMDSPNFVTHSLTAAGADASEDGTGRGTPLVAIRTANTNANGHGIAEDVTHALDGAQGQAVAFTERTRKDGRNFEASPDLAFALTNPGSVGRTHSRQLMDGMGVRRLTPTECERLMSWEDGHTQYGASGKEMSDSTRYRMCGNGVVSNVAEYLARRIREVL